MFSSLLIPDSHGDHSPAPSRPHHHHDNDDSKIHASTRQTLAAEAKQIQEYRDLFEV
jgi:hypothetical protein